MDNEKVYILDWDEDYLYLSNGEKVSPPIGTKFDPDLIKRIMEAGD